MHGAAALGLVGVVVEPTRHFVEGRLQLLSSVAVQVQQPPVELDADLLLGPLHREVRPIDPGYTLEWQHHVVGQNHRDAACADDLEETVRPIAKSLGYETKSALSEEVLVRFIGASNRDTLEANERRQAPAPVYDLAVGAILGLRATAAVPHHQPTAMAIRQVVFDEQGAGVVVDETGHHHIVVRPEAAEAMEAAPTHTGQCLYVLLDSHPVIVRAMHWPSLDHKQPGPVTGGRRTHSEHRPLLLRKEQEMVVEPAGSSPDLPQKLGVLRGELIVGPDEGETPGVVLHVCPALQAEVVA
mmetsp:Transcript_105943/g.341795  ORF Transcript_105943/g.341795 Transcript_105943/m.341795 type:complete len:299 (+) Transcript_105943:234-1130(+)